MKKYAKPVLEIREIRVTENLAANTKAGAALDFINRYPTTTYTLSTVADSADLA